MIDYTHFEFASPPRTGTTWFLKACSVAGLGEGFKAHAHFPCPLGGKTLKVSLVRHPCRWLPSYFHAIKGGHTYVKSVDVLSRLDFTSFDHFIDSYLCEAPGALFEIVKEYNADTYLRTEDLPWAFIELLEACGVQTDHRRLLALGFQNPSKDPPVIQGFRHSEVMRAEKELADAFSYY